MLCVVRLLWIAVPIGIYTATTPLFAINVSVDYTYDTSDFFGAGNPDGAMAGAMARNSLEAAAGYYSEILTDTFSSIHTPATFYSGTFAGVFTWQWQLDFPNPYTGVTTTLYDQTIAEDEYRIYVGARSLSGSTLGEGGPGGWGWSGIPSGGGYTLEEINEINSITDEFADAVAFRGEASGFANWGGALTFDSDGSTNWHYDHTTLPAAGESDFLSVAIHDIGHSLGLGASNTWDGLSSGTSFLGSIAVAEYGGPVPLDCDGSCTGHWKEGTASVIHGTSTPQEAAMNPVVMLGKRSHLTDLDAAALADIGWSVSAVVPEPNSAVLMLLGITLIMRRRF